MKRIWTWAIAPLAALGVMGGANAALAKDIMGASCTAPAPVPCVGAACTTAQPNATDPKTGRKFFLDYPCDLKANEKVIFVLNLHGAGSSSVWQHRYFPIVDYVSKYRLVVATPQAATSPTRVPGQPGTRMWVAAEDDAFLESLSDQVIAAFGKQNIKSFWLAGHSQGGGASARIVCTPYFASKVDGFLSLSGGRVGGSHMNPRFGPPKADGSPPDARPAAAPGPLPACEFSHIYETGEYEITDLQTTSPWADQLGCKPRVVEKDIVDTDAGYVWDNGRAGYKVWGMKAHPGTANEFLYPGCRDKRVVADVVRLDKGHTEGLEPKVTETLVKLIAGAPGGKLAKGG